MNAINLQENIGEKMLRKTEVQLRVDNLETRAILGSSPRTMTHNTEYNNDEEQSIYRHLRRIVFIGFYEVNE
jgi:hypothetical protein